MSQTSSTTASVTTAGGRTLLDNGIYLLKIQNFPWSDAWAVMHAQDNLGSEYGTRMLLDGQKVQLCQASAPGSNHPDGMRRSLCRRPGYSRRMDLGQNSFWSNRGSVYLGNVVVDSVHTSYSKCLPM